MKMTGLRVHLLIKDGLGIDSEGHRQVGLRRDSTTAGKGLSTYDIPGDFGTLSL